MSTSCPGDKGPGLISHGVDSCKGQLVSGSEGLQFRPALINDSHLGPSSRGVDQHFRTTHSRVQGPAVSTTSPGRLGPVSKCLQGRSAVPGYKGLCPFACGVYPHSWVNHVHVRGPTMSTRYLWPLGTGSEGPQVDQVSWVTRAHAQGPAGSNRCPGRLRPSSEVLHVRPAVPGHSRLGPRASGIDPLSWATGARVQRTSGLTSGPG